MKTILPRPRRHARRVAAAARWGGDAGGAGTMRARPGWARPQLAIDYAHRFAADYALVWWIDAEQSVLIAEQLVALAARLHLAPGPGSPPRWSGCWPSCAAATAGY